MKKCLLLFFLLFASVAVGKVLAAQDNDSLLYEATVTGNKNRKIDLYTQLAISYIDVDDAKTDEYFKTALAVCTKFSLEQKEVMVVKSVVEELVRHNRPDMVLIHLGGQEQMLENSECYDIVANIYSTASCVFLDNGNIEMASLYLFKSKMASSMANDTTLIINNSLNLGFCYSELGDLHKAVTYYKEAERLTIEKKDYNGLIDIYMNMGTAYMHMNMCDSAIEYQFKALKYSVQTNDSALFHALYYNVSCAYFHAKEYDEAIAYAHKYIDLEDVPNSRMPKNLANIYSAVAEMFLEMGQVDSSVTYLKRSIDLYRAANNKEMEADVLCKLGNLYVQAGNAKALKVYQKALTYCDSVSSLVQKQVYIGISNVYSQKGDHVNAHRYLKKAYDMADSALIKEVLQSKSSLSQQLNVKEEILKVERQVIDNKRYQQNENNRQEARRHMLIVVLVIILALTVLIISILLHVRNTNIKLKQANGEIKVQKDKLEIANQKAQLRFEFLDSLINSLPTPFVYMDSKGMLIGCNNAFEQASGLSRNRLIGFNLNDIYEQTGVGWPYEYGKSYDFMNIGKMKFADGQNHDVFCHRSTLNDDAGGYGKLTCLLIVDVTEQENIRCELSQSQKRLEDALNVKTKFFSIFAHDLKNPFNGILGLTNLLSECYDNYSSNEIRKYLNVINDSATNVYHLLTNLLDWAKSQTGMLEVNPSNFVITEPIIEAINLNEHIIEQKHMNIERQFEESISVLADRNMILAVVRNLLGNALKYTADGGTITFKVMSAGPDKVTVSVSDNGSGMEPEKVDRLFNVDHPISTPGLKNEKGSGLGLIICYQFIKQNGGDIFVESELGKGTTFTFVLNKV